MPPKVTYRKGRVRGTVRVSGRTLVRCGDCDARLEIHHDPDDGPEDPIEINGVLASRAEWLAIMLPILKPVGKKRRPSA